MQQHLAEAANRLPAVMFALAVAGGVFEALRSHLKRNDRPPADRGHSNGRRIATTAAWAVAAAALFTLPLLNAWSGARSDGYSAFGFFPLSDAGNYYRGAMEFLETGTMHPWNCRRPFNTALLAVQLAANGNDIRAVQLLQAVSMGLAAFSISWIAGRDLGWPSGLLIFSVLFASGAKCAHWLSSEWLGLTMGALAASLLWIGARNGRMAPLGWGMAALTMALNARAGAFLVLPALVVWAGLAGRKGKRFHTRGALLSLVCILFGFLVNVSMISLYGGRPGIGHGNFSMTLYGLASGKPGWDRIYKDFPESRDMPEDAMNEFAFRKSKELLAVDPSLMLKSLARASKEAISGLPRLRGVDPGFTRSKAARLVVVPCMALGIVVFLWRFRLRPEATMAAWLFAGYLLSAPFLWFDGEERIFTATLPVLALFLSFGISGWRRGGDLPVSAASIRENSGSALLPSVAAAAVVIAALAGPYVAYRGAKAVSTASLPQPMPAGDALIRSDALRAVVLESYSTEPTFVPRIARIDFLRNSPDFAKDDFRSLPRPGVVFYARNLLAAKDADLVEKYIWVFGPAEMALDKPRFLLLNGTLRKETNVFRVTGFSVFNGGRKPAPASGRGI